MNPKTLCVVVSMVVFAGCNCGSSPGADAGIDAGGGSTGGGTAVDTSTATVDTVGTGQDPNNFGKGIAVALDAANLPLVAFYSFDANGDDDYADSSLLFSRFDAATKKYLTPVTVDATIGDDRKLIPHIAVDGTTVAIAYAKDDATSHVRGIWLAVSTNGGTSFTTNQVNVGDNVYGYSGLGLHAGTVHVFYNQDENIAYRSGAVTALPTAWAATVNLPLPGTSSASSNGALSATVDATGTAHVVFGVSDDGNLTYAYWKTGATESSKVIETGHQNDFWGSAIAVTGSEVRIAAHYGGSTLADRIRVSSSTNGTTWSAPLEVLNDGGQSPGDRMAMAIGPTGQTAITYQVAGGNLDGTTCTTPKVARSTAFSAFTTCSPTMIDFDADYPTLAFGTNGKLVVAFQNARTEAGLVGVIVYREP